MSETTPDAPTRLDLEQVLTQLARARAETEKFVAERNKLLAEAAKLNRDRFLAPALALAATLGAIATFAPAILRAIGGHE